MLLSELLAAVPFAWISLVLFYKNLKYSKWTNFSQGWTTIEASTFPISLSYKILYRIPETTCEYTESILPSVPLCWNKNSYLAVLLAISKAGLYFFSNSSTNTYWNPPTLINPQPPKVSVSMIVSIIFMFCSIFLIFSVDGINAILASLFLTILVIDVMSNIIQKYLLVFK